MANISLTSVSELFRRDVWLDDCSLQCGADAWPCFLISCSQNAWHFTGHSFFMSYFKQMENKWNEMNWPKASVWAPSPLSIRQSANIKAAVRSLSVFRSNGYFEKSFIVLTWIKRRIPTLQFSVFRAEPQTEPGTCSWGAAAPHLIRRSLRFQSLSSGFQSDFESLMVTSRAPKSNVCDDLWSEHILSNNERRRIFRDHFYLWWIFNVNQMAPYILFFAVL